MSVGQRIRFVRSQKKISTNHLAEMVGVSRSLISQVERDRANPSIHTLRKIAAALQVPIVSFFEEDAPGQMVVRADERKTLKSPKSKLEYQLLTPDLNRQIEFVMIEVKPGDRGGQASLGHEGEECALVLSGTLHVWIGEQEFVLNAGDSIAFNSGIPHRIANLGEQKVVLVTAITPPSF